MSCPTRGPGPAAGPLHCRVIGDAAPGAGDPAEQLRAHPGCVPATPPRPGSVSGNTLGVWAGGGVRQEAVAETVRLVSETRGRARGQEVAELGEAALGPGVASRSVPLVAHDVAVIPAAAAGPRTPDISDWAVTVMNRTEEVGDLVSGHNDPAVASAVLDYADAVDLP